MNDTLKKNSKWFKEFKNGTNGNFFVKNPVAYFCSEFALSRNFPSYAGGLGVLAGDYLLEASKIGFPIIGLSLLYKRRQNGKLLSENNRKKSGIKCIENLLISIPIEQKNIFVKVWKWTKNNNSVYFLDTDVLENDEADRKITEKLYADDRETRIKQELILGTGGVRLLQTLDISPSIYHMNEGHSAFIVLELLGNEIEKGIDFDNAFKNIKQKIVFTNHTLVPEGQELFAIDSLERNTKKICDEYKIDFNSFSKKGIVSENNNLFSMTVLALNSSSIVNAVSKIHLDTAKSIWGRFNTTYITNGIHIDRWDKVKNGDIVKKHEKREGRVLKMIRKIRGDDWKKEALLIGWSRRFVPYKRPLALLDDIEKLKEILERFKGKVHIVYSAPLSKKDQKNNEFYKKINELINSELKGYLTFIPDYKLKEAELLVSGCDVWLNTPIVGKEACGTSGMKAALNGTLLVSTNDGWINEIPLDNFGWTINNENVTADILDKLVNKIIPEYENFILNKNDSIWKKKMIDSRNLILNNFSMSSKLIEYIEKIYLPTILNYNK